MAVAGRKHTLFLLLFYQAYNIITHSHCSKAEVLKYSFKTNKYIELELLIINRILIVFNLQLPHTNVHVYTCIYEFKNHAVVHVHGLCCK